MGIKHIANIKSRKKSVLISQMRNEEDDVEASRKGIADTFTKFYSSLYAKEEHDDVEDIEVEEIPTNHEELSKSQDQSTKNK